MPYAQSEKERPGTASGTVFVLCVCEGGVGGIPRNFYWSWVNDAIVYWKWIGDDMHGLNLKCLLRLCITESFSYFFKEELVCLKGHNKISPITVYRLNMSRARFTGKYVLAISPLLWWHKAGTRLYSCFVSPEQDTYAVHRPAHGPVNLAVCAYKIMLGKIILQMINYAKLSSFWHY